MNLANIPQVLKDTHNWVCWRFTPPAPGKKKHGKEPISVVTGYRASHSNPKHWTSFERAVEFSANPTINGIGCVFSLEMGMVGVDLDDVIDDSGNVQDWALEIINDLDTYTEISPSGTGVKMWAYGAMPDNKGSRKKYETSEVEMYPQKRFFCTTGNSWPGAPKPIAKRQEQLDRLYAKINPPAPKKRILEHTVTPVMALTDDEIWNLLGRESNGKASRLLAGTWTAEDYRSASEADAATACKLVFYTGDDKPRVIRMMRASKMYREKMDRDDYMDATVSSAIKLVNGRFYDGNGRKPPDPPIGFSEPEPSTNTRLHERISRIVAGDWKNVFWPWKILTHTAKALLPGEITILCGGAGSTKSMMVSDCCLDWMAQDLPFSVFHLEGDVEFHMHRMVAQYVRDSGMTDPLWIENNPDKAFEYENRSRDLLERFERDHLYCGSDKNVTLGNLADWVRDRCKDGHRVIVIDPVTMAATGDKSWLDDQKFMANCQRSIRESGSSLILVTHPRGGPKSNQPLDRVAGGLSYVRFSSCVLWLESLDDDTVLKIKSDIGIAHMPVNRMIQIWKCRNGIGAGVDIGFWFDKTTLKFKEQGIIQKEKKR